MKKTFIILLCMMAGLLSCSNDDNIMEEKMPAGVPMTFNITVDEASTTRAYKTSWADGDKIYVFFNDLATKYLILTYDCSTSKWNCASGGGTLLDTDFSGLSIKRLTAVHFPVEVDVTYADSKFSFTRGGKPVYNYYLSSYYQRYTVDGATVNATLSMGKPENMVLIHVAGIQDNVADYTFGCSKIKPVACIGVSIDGVFRSRRVLQAGARLSGIADADGAIFAGQLVYPDERKDYTFTIASNTQIFTLTRKSKALTAGKMYNFPSLTTTGDKNWTVTNVSDLYVDLGLSVKWAKCNLGATTETGYGDYFAWGENAGYSDGKTNFDWSTYAWGTTKDALTKYCSDSSKGKNGFTDALTTLEKDDDAAYAALGGKFRMPTKDEMNELRSLPMEWVTDYNGSGINGYKFTGNNGNTLFLPAAGYRYSTGLHWDNSRGYYWSPSLYTSSPNWAYYYYFLSDNNYWECFDRHEGRSIRPVYVE